MNTAHTTSIIQEMPLSFIRTRHLVRAINSNYVNQLVHTVKRLGVKAFPLAATPEGVLFGGNHRFEAFMRLGLEKCWMHVYQPASIDREALELNEATEELLPMSFVDHAELVWRKLADGQTQQAVADEMGWTRERVRDYAALQKISSETWTVIGATFRKIAPNEADGCAPNFGASAPFTEGRIRDEILVPQFYRVQAMDGRYVLLDKGSLAVRLQREFGIDTVFQAKTGEMIAIEEKIDRRGFFTGNFALETHSCTIPGRESHGWMAYSAADWLLYAFVTDAAGLDCHLIDLPKLRAWFWPIHEQFKTFGPLSTLNRTMGRLVPITEVHTNVPTWAFPLAPSGKEVAPC
jgi:hypothetical protein